MWQAVATLITQLIDYFGKPSDKELGAILLALRSELLEHALGELARAANTPPQRVSIPTLDIATDVGIHHAEHGWFVGENTRGPVWDPDPKVADKFRTIGIAEHALVLHGLKGAPGVTIETIPAGEE